MKKNIAVFCLFLALAGCSKCILIRSEYYDITGSVLASKALDAPIELYLAGQDVEKPNVEIGAIKVMAQYGTSKEAFNRELIKRARLAGADAVINVEYSEDKSNDLRLCGKLLATKRNMTATGKAVVFSKVAAQIEKK